MSLLSSEKKIAYAQHDSIDGAILRPAASGGQLLARFGAARECGGARHRRANALVPVIPRDIFLFAVGAARPLDSARLEAAAAAHRDRLTPANR
jgi:hypothetical protein